MLFVHAQQVAVPSRTLRMGEAANGRLLRGLDRLAATSSAPPRPRHGTAAITGETQQPEQILDFGAELAGLCWQFAPQATRRLGPGGGRLAMSGRTHDRR